MGRRQYRMLTAALRSDVLRAWEGRRVQVELLDGRAYSGVLYKAHHQAVEIEGENAAWHSPARNRHTFGFAEIREVVLAPHTPF